MRRPAFIIAAVLVLATGAEAARVKDLTAIRGVRENQLLGYGLVVGLNGTGDSSKAEFTIQSLTSMLEKLGVTVDAGSVQVGNVAAVIVTAQLPPFARVGSRIDILVSSLGDSKSLLGGTLLLTPLRAPDQHVYAVGQGAVSIGGGFALGSGSGDVAGKNHPTAGLIPGGAIVEREVPFSIEGRDQFTLALQRPDFTTAVHITDAINAAFGESVARSVDAGTVELRIPEDYRAQPMLWMSKVERVDVEPDTKSRVVVVERTGTVVLGKEVSISTVAISHGNLNLSINSEVGVSQPAPLSSGETTVVTEDSLQVVEERGGLVVIPESVSLGDVVRGLNAIGASGRDLIAILQALQAAGALHAMIEII